MFSLLGGLVLFGLLSIIMDIFKIASYVGYLHCDSAVKVVLPVVQLVFIIAQVKLFIASLKCMDAKNKDNFTNLKIHFQTYFLWIHAKDCVQVQKNITR